MADVTIKPFSFDEVNEAPIELENLQEVQESPKPTEKKPQETPKEEPVVENQGEEQIDNSNSSNSNENIQETEDEEAEPAFDYKKFADALVEDGTWDEFKLPEGESLDAEAFVALAKVQTERKAAQLAAEEIGAYGAPANQLIEYLKNGGKLEEFVQVLDTQTDIETLSTKDPTDQETIIKEYYSATGKSKEWITKHLNRIKDEGATELELEAETCKTDLLSEINEQKESMLREQEAVAKDRKLRTEAFNSNLRKQIHSDTELADRDKKSFEKFAFEIKYQDQNTGAQYTEFQKKLFEIRNDPKKEYKFMKFVNDFEAFEEKTKTEKAVNKKTYNFLVGSQQTLSDASSREPVKATKFEKKIPAFKF